jgi:hypothetical protein
MVSKDIQLEIPTIGKNNMEDARATSEREASLAPLCAVLRTKVRCRGLFFPSPPKHTHTHTHHTYHTHTPHTPHTHTHTHHTHTHTHIPHTHTHTHTHIQGVSGEIINILGGGSIDSSA